MGGWGRADGWWLSSQQAGAGHRAILHAPALLLPTASSAAPPETAVQAVTGAGYDAILSAPWYLNLGCYAGEDWKG